MYANKTESPDHGLPLTNKKGMGCFGGLTGAAHQPDQIRDLNSRSPERDVAVGIYSAVMRWRKNAALLSLRYQIF